MQNETSKNNNSTTQQANNKVVLAFSGGLDTSFCIPYLIEKGFQVTTVFVDSGGVTYDEKQQIEQRALQLGAVEHKTIDIGQQLWAQVITPLIWSGYWYQNQYPLLCSDRYLIVESCLKICDQLNTKNFAHGCTGMGNDQVRFDLAVSCLKKDFNIISPIREIQKITTQVRDYEMQFLAEKGHHIPNNVKHYSINQNLMGVTISGSEIDQWQQPDEASYVLTQPLSKSIQGYEKVQLEFYQGNLLAINNKKIDKHYSGDQAMQDLNKLAGKYSIGRGIYTGDTSIGLKGRIVFEAPALTVLQTAHTALQEAVCSKAQNRFKNIVAQKWSELVYEGLFYDPLKQDLQAFLKSSQQQVTGKVTVQLSQSRAQAVAIDSKNILTDKQATYAQSASWTIEEASGFIKLFGKSSVLAAQQRLKQSSKNKAKTNE